MKTLLTESHIEAAEIIKKDGIVAFPTETVYGLGVDIFNENAIQKVFQAKGRPADNPLIAHIGNLDQINLLAKEINRTAASFIDQFFPGPLTIVLEKRERVPLLATAGLETIGIRMPRNIVARKFLNSCENPLVAPSANISGKPSPTSWEAVFEDLDGKIDCILQGKTTEIGLESTVLDCTNDIPIVLRTGAVSLEDLQEIIPQTKTHKPKSSEFAKSPGLKHKHYSPNARVVIVSTPEDKDIKTEESAFIGITKTKQEFRETRICNTPEEYARNLYSFFRHCDERKITTIYCERVREIGIGTAIMDRLRRAAE